MVFTWIGDVRPLLEASCYQKYWQQLPDFRREKANRCRSLVGRALSVGVWFLWQRARREYSLPSEASFNLSHSGFYALCSAEIQPGMDVQVGCDVEQVGRYREAVARRFFCLDEYRHIQGQKDETCRRELFFRYWVLKESFMKATRQGMAMALDSFSFALEEGGGPTLKVCAQPYQKEAYHFREFALESYRVAVCSTDSLIDSRLRWIKF